MLKKGKDRLLTRGSETHLRFGNELPSRDDFFSILLN
jgi:hypothetical protein